MVGLFSSGRANDASSAVGMFGRRSEGCVVCRTMTWGLIFSATTYLGLFRTCPDRRGVTDGSAQILRQEDQVKRIGRRRLEARIDPVVESGRLGCLGVDQKGSHPDALGDRSCLQQTVPDQRRAESPSLLLEVDSESSEDQD